MWTPSADARGASLDFQAWSALGTTSIGELIRSGERSFSFEFMPPQDEAGEAQLWKAISELEPYRPTFVSVTYGAGGSTRDTTVRITGRIARETSMVPMGHLTCVGHTREELVADPRRLRRGGVRNSSPCAETPGRARAPSGRPRRVGSPTPASWSSSPASTAGSPWESPRSREGHPAAESLEHDAQVLVDKQRAGAEFAITAHVLPGRRTTSSWSSG